MSSFDWRQHLIEANAKGHHLIFGHEDTIAGQNLEVRAGRGVRGDCIPFNRQNLALAGAVAGSGNPDLLRGKLRSGR